MSGSMKVPFLDLIAPHAELKAELNAVFATALATGDFIGGPMVHEFEQRFADFCDVKYCVGVSSGTDALRFALMAAGVGAGDAVITVPNTFIATIEAISQAGAYPEFVDVDERSSNMNPEKLREYLEFQCEIDSQTGRPINRKSGRRVAAVIPVHLYGQTADMDPILELAERYGIVVIEDACQAHGAEYFSIKQNRWTKAGSIGRAAAFSFYPGKNLGACGEAGGITTNDEQLAQRVLMLRDHGQANKYYHDIEGYNGRLDAIQAGIMTIKLRHLEEWNYKRRLLACKYRHLFESTDNNIVIPFDSAVSKPVYHLYVIRSQERDQLKQYLAERNIGTGIHYPLCLHLQKACHFLGYKKGDFPVSEKLAAEILSLPMYPQMDAEQQAYVARQIGEFNSKFSLNRPFTCEAQQVSVA